MVMDGIELSVTELTVERNYRRVFNPITFQLSSGDSLYLKGANGVGKTTTLRLLSGVGQRYQGTIMLNGLDRQEWAHLYSTHLHYLGHRLGLKEELSGLDNLRLLLKLRGVNEVSEAAILEVFDTLKIPRQPRAIRYLSAGQRRRVMLARLWLDPRPLWILDEPYTSLDVDSIAQLEQKIIEHCQEGGAVIFTSHQAPTEATYTKIIELEGYRHG